MRSSAILRLATVQEGQVAALELSHINDLPPFKSAIKQTTDRNNASRPQNDTYNCVPG